MSFTLAGYSESVAHSTLDFIAALPDMSLRIDGDDVIVPELSLLGACQARGNSIVQGVFYSPSLREINNLNVNPVRQQWGTSARNEQMHIMDFFHRPIPLAAGEALNLKINCNGATHQFMGLVWFMNGIDAAPTGPWRSVRAYNATTVTANAWSNVALTWDEELPVGRYAIIGATGWGGAMRAFRFVISGYPWRPGTYGMGEHCYPVDSAFRFGNKGSWGEFESDLPPTVDVLSGAADSDHKFALDLVQIRKGR